MKTFEFENRNIYLLTEGSGGPVVFLGIFKGATETAQKVFDFTKDLLPGKAFTLAAFEANDWNANFSPWPAKGLDESQVFTGGGNETLAWLVRAKAAVLNELNGASKVFIAGYSLAGLFALWSFYESKKFDGCASCSGSLWYEGFIEYAKGCKATAGSAVYLSLGGKEENSNNPVMATVGVNTREMDKILSLDPNVSRHKLEMNSGGHFSNPEKRLAKGIAYLIQ